jgi:hypothetical protein
LREKKVRPSQNLASTFGTTGKRFRRNASRLSLSARPFNQRGCSTKYRYPVPNAGATFIDNIDINGTLIGKPGNAK